MLISRDSTVKRESPHWAEWLSSVPEVGTSVILTLAGVVLGAYLSSFSWIFLFFGILLLILGILFSLLRQQRELDLHCVTAEDYDTKVSDLEESYRNLLQELTMTSFMVAKGIKGYPGSPLKHQMELVQKAVLQAVSHRLGPVAGVRSCLFLVQDTEEPLLKAWKFGEEGRLDPPSRREFRPGDKTFDFAVAKLERFVEDIGTVEVEKDTQVPIRYRTFAAYPVANDDYLYGILTVDAPEVGDISKRDRVLLGFFASILTITFSVQRNVPAIPLEKYE